MVQPFPISVQEKIDAAIEAARPTLELLPGVSIVNDIRDGSVHFMSQRGLQLLGTSLAELREMGAAYHERFFNAEQAAEYVPLVLDLVARNDPAETLTFFQQVRFAGEPGWQWHLSSLRIFVQDESGTPVALLAFAQHLNPERHFTRKVDRLLKELDFIHLHAQTFETLGDREREVLKLMAEGCSTAEVAEKLNISVLTAETHRKNVRRKLKAQHSNDLLRYASAFDLI
ncbi:helix-turn-helix transcriptional regulator [Flaviaesturariibacter aridisoli]|uniref:LuxR family transcriptional regulator n=1 Tax=Flaviaesturariibacter aridisoli TaxID=2545761 RepID=A0A4R4DP99_9BACT|nr:helix-turn-helix transcriptional regulator [Flaviaesturariibacter aridisoli]TCZ63464.1 LuxR family transcriptional regulator [Flaviaesturariibacter aridisoli]